MSPPIEVTMAQDRLHSGEPDRKGRRSTEPGHSRLWVTHVRPRSLQFRGDPVVTHADSPLLGDHQSSGVVGFGVVAGGDWCFSRSPTEWSRSGAISVLVLERTAR